MKINQLKLTIKDCLHIFFQYNSTATEKIFFFNRGLELEFFQMQLQSEIHDS